MWSLNLFFFFRKYGSRPKEKSEASFAWREEVNFFISSMAAGMAWASWVLLFLSELWYCQSEVSGRLAGLVRLMQLRLPTATVHPPSWMRVCRATIRNVIWRMRFLSDVSTSFSVFGLGVSCNPSAIALFGTVNVIDVCLLWCFPIATPMSDNQNNPNRRCLVWCEQQSGLIST